jgi:hypothetical protein
MSDRVLAQRISGARSTKTEYLERLGAAGLTESKRLCTLSRASPP